MQDTRQGVHHVQEDDVKAAMRAFVLCGQPKIQRIMLWKSMCQPENQKRQFP